MSQTWRKCSTCKKDILLGSTYYICSVSTCTGRATNYVFCTIGCWDGHLPIERHRPDAGALERKAPLRPDEEAAPASQPRKIVPASTPRATDDEVEILVVASKVRKYITDTSGLNTSASVYIALTSKLKRLCDLAINQAKAHGRKTVMDRDVV